MCTRYLCGESMPIPSSTHTDPPNTLLLRRCACPHIFRLVCRYPCIGDTRGFARATLRRSDASKRIRRSAITVSFAPSMSWHARPVEWLRAGPRKAVSASGADPIYRENRMIAQWCLAGTHNRFCHHRLFNSDKPLLISHSSLMFREDQMP